MLKSVGNGYLLGRCEIHTGLVPFTPNSKGQTVTIIEPELIDKSDGEDTTLTIAEFLTQWGCDPCYDRHPRKPGDGYAFYNYGPEGDSLTYLKAKLLPALSRQVQDETLSAQDRENFQVIQHYITEKVAALEAAQDAPPVVDETQTFTNEMLVKITYADVRKAMKCEPLTMRVVGHQRTAFAAAVNLGIDARLQVCFSPDRGDKFNGATGRAVISIESLPVLIRRLYEADDEHANSLAAGIMQTLGFSDTGKWKKREDD
jgi:hypothetical protein